MGNGHLGQIDVTEKRIELLEDTTKPIFKDP